MKKRHILSGVLTAACTAVILAFVLVEARVALRPHLEMSFSPPPIAYGYAFRNVFITGVVYNDEGITPVGTNRVVAVTFDGGSIRGTGATTSTGYYAISNLSHSGVGVVVTAFLQDVAEDAVTVTTLSGGDLLQFNLYRNRLIVRSDSGSYALTNAHLNTGDNNGDSDLLAVYRSTADSKVATQSGKTLHVWREDTFKPGGTVSAGSGITLVGTFQPEGNTVTLSGSWAKKAAATFTFATSTVVMNGVNQILSGSTIFKNFTKTVTAGDTLNFNAGLTQTFTGALTLNGAENALLKLRSTTGAQWSLNPQSTRSVRFLDVKNSRNTNATAIDCLTGCIDSGSNLLWNFGRFSVGGTVYSDEGTTAIGANRIVAASVNGGPRVATGATTATGYYALSNLQFTGGLVLTVFLDNGVEKAATTTILSSTGVTGYNLYQNNLILRSDSGSHSITNAHLATADNGADSDLLAVFFVDAATQLGTGSGRGVFVWTGDTYVPGARVRTHDLDVRGTMTLGTNGLTASGSVEVSGTMTTSTGILLASLDREILALTGVTLQTLTVDNGLWGYWRLDDGTGSTVARDSSRFTHPGTLSGIAPGSSSGWILGSTGTTLFTNAKALYFDGTTDFVNIGDALDAEDGQDFTITAWVNRSSFDGKHTILAKKTGSGAAAAGYAVWIDDATDTVQFKASDGTDDYQLTSASAFAAAGWRHIAVVWDDNSVANTEIYINGTADSATDTGTIGNVNDLSTSESLRIGAESDGERSFHGKIDDVRVYRRALGPSEIRALAQGNKATGSGTYTLGSALDINSDLRIYGGTIDVGAASKNITIAGNINNQGGFTRGSGTVTLDGSAQTISGSTIFNSLRKIGATAITLFLDFTSKQSVSGSLLLTGADATTKMSIRSTKSGALSKLVLDSAGTQILRNLNVKDTTASGGALLSCATNCTDSGNVFRWTFACGDSVVSSSEGCDDGSVVAGDGCSATCTVESGYSCTGTPSSCSTSCGDGVMAGSEQCDNAGSNSNAADAACRTDCRTKRCGDGIRDTGESCDDGNGSNNDECTNSCTFNNAGGGGGGANSSSNTSFFKRPPPPLGCGNAILEKAKGEECDEGRFNDLGTCSYNCKLRYCGDGEVTVIIGEDCEPTPSAGPNGERIYEVASCGQICTVPDASGHGGCQINYLRACGEDGGAASSEDSVYYPPNGDIPTWEDTVDAGGGQATVSCGDGWVNAPEECDDANHLNGDGCSSSCTVEGSVIAVCGDGILLSEEECDDGNNADGDGCSAFCVRESPTGPACGNSTVDDGEECDTGAKNSDTAPNACRLSCKASFCGDYVADRNEQCDQGPANSSLIPDRCRADCSLPRCGDGIRDAAEECDGSFGCSAQCTLPTYAAQCGNGITEDTEQCDDANDREGDGCSMRCRREAASSSATPRREEEKEAFVLDADIVVVNPTEIAVALKFLPDPDPCARVTASGEEVDAGVIRSAATRQGIPIVKNIPLAQAIRAENPVGSTVKNPWCVQVNMLRSLPLSSASSSARMQSASSSVQLLPPQYRPIASMIPAQPVHAPVGDTGPGAIVLVGAGAAGAVGWIRRKKLRTEN